MSKEYTASNKAWRRIAPVVACVLIPLGDPPLAATDEQAARLYRNRDEQREAGLRHPVTDWLVVSGLAESEWYSEKRALAAMNNNDRQQDTTSSLQLAAFIEATEWGKVELIVEYDSSIDDWATTEATLAIEYENWELVIGRQDISFGEYFSHFATGPLLEFGEINASAVSLAFNHEDRFDIALSVYRSRGRSIHSDERQDWNLAMEIWPTEQLVFGLSYLSDLADTDDRLLAEFDNRYANRVDAYSGYFLWTSDHFDLSLETVAALDAFSELDTDRHQPRAWNMELVYFVSPRLDLAWRIEGSRQLEDAPRRQLGMAITYRLHQYAALTLEALRGDYQSPLAVDANDQDYDQVDTLAAQLVIAF